MISTQQQLLLVLLFHFVDSSRNRAGTSMQQVWIHQCCENLQISLFCTHNLNEHKSFLGCKEHD